MELLKKNIYMMQERDKITGQQLIEQDPNVPDSMPDVERIVENNVEVHIDEMQVETDKVTCSGYLQIQILYIAEEQEHSLQRLETKVPFQQWQNIPNLSAQDKVQVKWTIEDASVRIINSRKLSVRALLVFTYWVEEANDVQAVVEIHGINEVSCRKKELELLHLIQNKKDIVRFKESFFLNSSKPDIEKILWKTAQLRSVETHLKDGRLEVKGEIFLFVLYEGSDEEKSREWLEVQKSFQEELECPQCRSDLISEIDVSMDIYSLEAENDEDGEKRKLSLEATLGLDIHLYEEEYVQIIEDVYTPVKELVPIREERQYERLLTKHTSQIRVTDRVKISGSQPRMMQTCSGWGEVKVDDVQTNENGLLIEGAVLVRIMYVSSDDRIPYSVLEGAIPFQQTIESAEINSNCRYRIAVHLEQMSTSMIDSEEVEVKALLKVEGFVMKIETEQCMVDIEERNLDMKKLQAMPGIIGYIVQPEDSLWEIARKYYTTPEKICSLNQITEKDVRPGVGLIILKTV